MPEVNRSREKLTVATHLFETVSYTTAVDRTKKEVRHPVAGSGIAVRDTGVFGAMWTTPARTRRSMCLAIAAGTAAYVSLAR